jgi:hypothetical protein
MTTTMAPRAPAVHDVADAVGVKPSGSGSRVRYAAVVMFVVAVTIAAYTGFRLPNAWTATLDAVSLTDGFHRRIVVGTLLHPLAVVTGYSYWVFATKSFLVLVALLVVVGIALIRARLTSQRVLVIAWLLLPTGGFFFHEVGYYDQLLYLLLFGGLWLLHRGRLVAASCLMTISVLVHEITAVTVLPVFAMAALYQLPVRRAALVVTPPALLTALVLGVPAASPGAPGALTKSLGQADFRYRADALELFGRTQSQSWQLYRITDVLAYLAPLAVLLIVAFVVLHRTGKVTAVPLLTACAAIAAPLLLAFGGWDKERWGFLLATNFFLVLWLYLRYTQREFAAPQIAVLAAVALLMARMPFGYFDGLHPRLLSGQAFFDFVGQLRHGEVFTLPHR